MERPAIIDVPRYVAEYVMERDVQVMVFKSLNPITPYAVEIYDLHSGLNHNLEMLKAS